MAAVNPKTTLAGERREGGERVDPSELIVDSVPIVRAGSAAAWLMAVRPRTLPVSLAPVLVGTAVASLSDAVQPAIALSAAAGAMGLQIGSNLANDLRVPARI